jgi:hypothetical protein
MGMATLGCTRVCGDDGGEDARTGQKELARVSRRIR